MNLYNTLSLPLLLLHLHIPYSTSTSLHPDPRFQTKSNRCHRLAFFASSSSSSCPAPRFDTFTDNILGPWEECNHNNPPAGSTTTTNTKKRGEVEEVMRSCGGAVQGIKEVPLLLPPPLPDHNNDEDEDEDDNDDDEGPQTYTNENTSERKYHNRADDGFVFFDCGSYVSLPKDISSSSSSGVIPNNIMCSLSLPTTNALESKRQQKIRTIITTGPPSFQTLVRGSSGSSSIDLDTKTEEVCDDDGNDENDVNSYKKNMVIPLTCAPKLIRWEKGIVCRMSSPGQPWMLQRASWEKILRDDDIDGGGGNTSSSIQNEHELIRQEEADTGQSRTEGWITSFNADDNKDGEGIPKSYVGRDSTKMSVVVPEGTSIIVQIGSCCRITNEVKAILCFYGNKYELKGVSLQEGYIQE